MSKAELESALKRLKSNFEDLEETISFNFTYSVAHVDLGQVIRDEESLMELKEEIRSIEDLLSKTGPGE